MNIFLKTGIEDEISFLNFLIEYPELCVEKCKERRDMLKTDANVLISEQGDKNGN